MAYLRGKVVTGRADFGQWIERLSNLYERKTGMRLYPGTLDYIRALLMWSCRRSIHFPWMSSGSKRMSMVERCLSAWFHAGSSIGGRSYCARIRTKTGQDITRGILSRLPLTYGCVTVINLGMEIGW